MIRGLAALAALVLSACSPPDAVEQKADEAVAPTEAGQAAEAAPAAPADAPATPAPQAAAPPPGAPAGAPPSAAPAGAEAAILAWARAQYGEIFEPLNIFYGDFTGDGAPDAFAWVNYPTGGNSAGLDVPLFRNQGGRMVYWRSEQEVFGEQPRNIAFAPGRITLTTSVLRDQDPRCCPTGARNWTINTN